MVIPFYSDIDINNLYKLWNNKVAKIMVIIILISVVVVFSFMFFVMKLRRKYMRYNLFDLLIKLSEVMSYIETDKIIRKLREFIKTLGIKKYSIMLYNQEDQTLSIRNGIGISDEVKRKLKLKIQEGVAGKVIGTGKPIFIKNIKQAEEYKDFFSQKERPDESLLSLPLKFSDRIFGVLNLHFNPAVNIDKITLQYLAIVAQQISIALSNAYNHEASLSDKMTGLLCHEYFIKRLSEEVELSNKYKLPLSLLFIDIDKFKVINDTYGHQTGDYVIKTIAKILKSSTRITDILGRYGGEEFAILLPETNEDGAYGVAERIRKLIEPYEFNYGNKKLKITVSIGVASYDGKRKIKPETIIKEADNALYRAKNLGRNRTVVAGKSEISK